MAIQWVSGDTFTCVSGDTKPTLVPAETKAIETNTDNVYRFNGTTWVIYSGPGVYTTLSATATFSNKTISNDSNTLPFVGAYNSVIYKSGTVYKSKKADGTLLASNTVLDSVVQAALDEGGLILWPSARGSDIYYAPSNALTGWLVKNGTTLLMSKSTEILPSSAFANTLFKIDDITGGDHVAKNIIIQGGNIRQAGATPTKTWTCFDLESAASATGDRGLGDIQIKDVYCKNPGVFIKLTCDTGTGAFINGCNFENLFCDYPHIGIEFILNLAANRAIHRNHFSNVIIQADPNQDNQTQNAMIYGMKIDGSANHFYNCKMWDVTPSNACCQIAPTAEDILIMGGLMTYRPYDWILTQDYGKRTVIIGDPEAAHTGYSNFGLVNPFIAKTGYFYGISASTTTAIGYGLLAPFGVHSGAGVYSETRTTSGLAKKMTTSTTVNSLSGLRNGTASIFRYFEPIMRTRFKLGTTTNQRIFVGYGSANPVTISTADDPLVSISGAGLYHSTTHGTSATNWLFARNNGNATSTFTNTGVAANNTNMCEVYVAGWEDDEIAWQWRVNSVVGQHGKATTGNFPGQTTGMAPGIWISNTAGEDKNMEVFMMSLRYAKSEIT